MFTMENSGKPVPGNMISTWKNVFMSILVTVIVGVRVCKDYSMSLVIVTGRSLYRSSHRLLGLYSGDTSLSALVHLHWIQDFPQDWCKTKAVVGNVL